LVLRRTVRSLPLWLEAGVARLAMSATRGADGLQLAAFDVADVRGYLAPREPARAVFSARHTSELWENALRRATFVRQSLVYAHRVLQTGDIGVCTSNAADQDDPATRLRACLRSDIDTFHARAMEDWPDGLARISLRAEAAPAPIAEVTLTEAQWHDRVTDALLSVGALSTAKRRLADWASTGGPDGSSAVLRARVALATGDPAAARRLFEAAPKPAVDPMDAYHYAAMLLEPAVRSGKVGRLPQDDAAHATALLDLTLGRQPFGDAYALQGIARLAAGDDSRAIQSLQASVETSWDETYALWLARAYASGRLTASARRLAASLAESSEDADVRDGAQRLLRELPADQGDADGVPVLPPLIEGEQRTHGQLRSIDCGDDWVTLLVETARGTHRFVTARLSLLRMVAFGPPPAPATCGPRRNAERVVVNWRRAPSQPAYATGVVSALAFVER
jgi:hypothetical protein